MDEDCIIPDSLFLLLIYRMPILKLFPLILVEYFNKTQKMKRYIVITSIFNPTKAIQSYSKMNDYAVIVVGDKKSPLDWHCDDVNFISIEKQDALDFELSKILPYNHYCRKMLGYLVAIENNAEYIIDTDDDNIPKQDWAFPVLENQYETITGEKRFINIYQLYTEQKIWPRGLPLNYINNQIRCKDIYSTERSKCKVGIWQGLADEDPDVDAIYRLTDNKPCYFLEREPIVLGKGIVSPYNSQNTLTRKELFTLLYLPTSVTFRFTDILRGLIAQPIMWLYDYHLGFINATVIQERNYHDYMKDFISEIPMYQYGEMIIDLVSNSISSSESITGNLFNAYQSLLKKHIVTESEMKTLNAWINDIERFI